MTATLAPAAHSLNTLIASPNAQSLVTQLVDAVRHWQQTTESEQTKRRTIAADEALWLAAIDADREALLTYLDRSFDERAANFRELFAKLDQAMETDLAQITDILGAITAIAVKNPFSGLDDAATVSARLLDRDTEW